MFIYLLLTLQLFSSAVTSTKTQCTEGLKARASLKFSECQDSLLPLRECYHRYPYTVPSVRQHFHLKSFGNKSNEADYCKTRPNMTSCEHLTYLAQVCGAHYDDCHTREEKKEIMRMWVKQFVQGTHEIHWEFAFSDNNMGIIHGDCNHILHEYFDSEDVAEIADLVNAGPNLWKNCTVDLRRSKQDWLCSTKISNLTQKFGIMKDKDGHRIGVGYRTGWGDVTYPSHWKYCSWKIKHALDYGRLFYYMSDLFHCDGKCNSNEGDNQQWIMRHSYFGYIDVETGKRIFNGYPGMNPTEHRGNLINCIWGAESIMKSRVAGYIFRYENKNEKLHVDKIKMQLCKPFKTILENCSIPISECIGTIAMKEIVMAEVLKDLVAESKKTMEMVNNHTQEDFFGDFSYDDCIIFGGKVARASLHSATLIQMVTIVMLPYFLISYTK